MRHRAERVLGADMEVPPDLHVAPVRDPAGLRGDGQQQRLLPLREHHGRPQPGGAVDPQPGPAPGPVIGLALRVGDVQELPAVEEAPLGELQPAPRGRALALTRQPRTQDLFHFCHQDLPERHPRHLSQNGRNRAILAGMVHQLATGVVP